MPQSDEVKREQARLRMQKMRNKANDNVTPDVTQYPAILLALTDSVKRVKLEKIYESLRNFKQEKNVYFGYPDRGIPFDIVGELLDAT